MKKRNLAKGLMLSVLALTFTLTGVSAASRTWSQTTVTGIPGGGSSKVSSTTNLKATGDTHATFNSVLVGPALGIRARLTDTVGTSRSTIVQAKEDKIVYATETADCIKGKYYKVRIYTNDIEWSSNSKATIKFSADKIGN